MKKIEVYLKNLLFKLLIALSNRKSTKKAPDPRQFSRVLFIRLNRIGDALVTTHLIKHLGEKYDFEVHILADRKNFFAFNNNPAVDKIIAFQKGISGIIKTIKRINSYEYDCIVDMHDDVSTTVSYLIGLSNAPYKFALKKKNYKIFSHTIEKLDPSKNHVMERNAEIVKLFDPRDSINNKNICIYPSESEMNNVTKLIDNYFIQDKFIVGVNISAGHAARFWGTERYEKLVEFFKQFDVNILLLAAPADKDLLDYLSDKYDVQTFYTKSFTEFAAMISKVNFLFTPDTSTVHLASAYEVPMFGIYVKYKTDNMIWYPYKSDYDVVITPEPNFESLAFSEVENKLKTFFEKKYNEYKNT